MDTKTTITHSLQDNANSSPGVVFDPQVEVKISLSSQGVSLGATDYGFPIYLEFRGGRLRVSIWANINDDLPTRVIDLGGAHSDAREFPESR